MNVLYCGDRNIIDGLMISVLSLAKNTREPLEVFVLTMRYSDARKKYQPITHNDVLALEKEIRKKNKNSSIKVIDITELFQKNPATANKHSYFTPYCMLRLYIDQIPNLPKKILYLDTDVVCLNNPVKLYNLGIANYEMAGVLDRYGSKIFRLPLGQKRYLNSGVLLMNLTKIKQTGLLERARMVCKRYIMIMPDQSALNFCAKYKKIVDKKYNDQKEVCKDTVFRHFSNTFQFFPYFKVQVVKPWQVGRLHGELGTHEFDDVIARWQELKEAK